MTGTNNSGKDPAEKIADGIKAIVCQLRRRLPETKVLILGIFPRGSVPQRKGKEVLEDAEYNPQWGKLDRVNEMISRLADGDMVHYLNINEVFLNGEGELTLDAMPDLLHPGEKGYKLWAEAMEPTISELMEQ
jgi:beta-glucosidase